MNSWKSVFGAVARTLFTAFAATCMQGTALAQPANYTTTDKGAIKRYESGRECMGLRKWECAESEFTKAADADPKFIEPRIMAEFAEQKGQRDVAMSR